MKFRLPLLLLGLLTAFCANADIKSTGGMQPDSTATLTNKTIDCNSNTCENFPGGTSAQFVTCTNGSSGSADVTLINAALTAASAAGGGTVYITSACTVNAQMTVPANVAVDGQHYPFLPASAGNWSGSAIGDAFFCADSGHDITIRNFNFDWTGSPTSAKFFACNGEVNSTSYQRINFFNNYGIAPGDMVAMTHVTGGKIIGNVCHQPSGASSAGACIDLWDNDFDIEEANNSLYVTTQGYGSIITGYSQSNVATNIRNVNIHGNYYELISSSHGISTGIYNQGYAFGACSAGTTDDSQNNFSDNILVVDAGVSAAPIRADECSSNVRIAGNTVVGDGSTVATHPAIEVNGGTNMGVDVTIENNKCVNFLGAAAGGADGGIFTNKGTLGSIVNNKGFGCGSQANLVGTYNVSSTTIIDGNDTGVGNVVYTSPVTLNGTTSGTGLDAYALAYLAAGHPVAASTLSASSTVSGAGFDAYLASGKPVAATTLTAQPTGAPTHDAGNVPYTMLQGAIPVVLPGSSFIDANGVLIIGLVPSNSATVSFSATSGSVTVTFSAATLLGTAADVGRVVIVSDTTYKTCTLTAQSSTTVATCTLGATLSGTGPFTNANTKLSGLTASNTVSFPVPNRIAYAAAYFILPAAAQGSAGTYYATCTSIVICTLFNNTYTSGTPTIPGSPTAFSGLTPASFTQATTIKTALSVTVAGNLLGTAGALGFDFDVLGSNDNNTKTATIFYNGVGCATPGPTTTFTWRYKGDIAESGDTAHQMCAVNQLNAAAVQNVQNQTVDDTTSHAAVISLTFANQYSNAAVERYAITLRPN